MNKVFLIGRLGKDVEFRYSQSGSPFGNFSIAVDASYNKDGQKVEKTYWFDVSCFGQTAELAANFLHKGSKVLVEGNLEVQEWPDRETGQNRSKVTVRAQRLEFLSPKSENTGGGSNYDGGQNAPHQNSGQGQYGGQSRNQNQNQAPRQNQNQSQSQSRTNAQSGQWDRNGGGNQGGGNQSWNGNQNQGYGNHAEDLGPAFPSEAAGMDDVPF